MTNFVKCSVGSNVDILTTHFIMFRLGSVFQKCFVARICCLECSSCEVTHGKLIGNSKPAAKGQMECIRQMWGELVALQNI